MIGWDQGGGGALYVQPVFEKWSPFSSDGGGYLFCFPFDASIFSLQQVRTAVFWPTLADQARCNKCDSLLRNDYRCWMVMLDAFGEAN